MMDITEEREKYLWDDFVAWMQATERWVAHPAYWENHWECWCAAVEAARLLRQPSTC